MLQSTIDLIKNNLLLNDTILFYLMVPPQLLIMRYWGEGGQYKKNLKSC